MIKISDKIIEYYNDYDEENRLVQANAQKLEYLTTNYVLEEVIPANSKILELGAGTGRYSFYYASKGHQVTATDVVPKHVEKMKNKLHQNPKIEHMKIELKDATDLTGFKDESFDVVLSLGPLYHLRNEADRIDSITESLRVLKPGGILAVAYINKFFILTALAKNNDLNKDYIDMILKNGFVESEDEKDFLSNAYFSSPKEIEEILNQFNVNKVEHVGTDGIGYLMRDMVNNMNEQEYENWIKYHLSTCKEPSILGYSNHGLYICKKDK
jgi:ubiquinone/menaquinone biosynthesis C-methylase UbiE